MEGGSGCATTASTGLSPLLTSLLSHCSHGGNSFTAETFVNDDRESGRRLRRWPERPSLTKVSGVKKWPPCEQWLNGEGGGVGTPLNPRDSSSRARRFTMSSRGSHPPATVTQSRRGLQSPVWIALMSFVNAQAERLLSVGSAPRIVVVMIAQRWGRSLETSVINL